MKPTVYSTYGETIDYDFDKSIEIYIDVFPTTLKTCDIRIFYAMEPDGVSCLSNEIIARQNEFDYILTFNNKILNNCKNAILFEFGTKWVYYKEYEYPEKKFSTSTVCGFKNVLRGHIIRHELWNRQDEIKTPIDFYISQYGGVENINNNKMLGESKNPLFDSMFHICVENSKGPYYFTEKLVDSFLMKSVPIYWGSEKISDYFNDKGFFVFNTVDELIELVNNLTPDDYFSRLSYIEENYKIAEYYCEWKPRFYEKTIDLIKKAENESISTISRL